MTEKSDLRKTWFVTRPQRDPVFHPDALNALDQATNHFTVKWEGNRPLQKEYEVLLIGAGLKRDNVSKDGSGGRTWAAMLRTFSYVYLDKDGYLKPTKAGAEIISGENEKENVKKQILTLQIPNAYFLDKGFRPKYDDGFRIFPVRFLLKVLNHPDLGRYLTRDEIVYFVMNAKKNEDIDLVVSRILKSRKADASERWRMHSEVAVQYEHRERSDSSARSYFAANADVAHTFMLLAEYAGGVSFPKGEAKLTVTKEQSEALSSLLEEFDRKYSFRDADRYASLDLLAQANGLSHNAFKLTPYLGVKPAFNAEKKLLKAKKILSDIPNASELSYADIVDVLSPVFTFDIAKKLAEKIDTSELTFAEDEFAKRYLHEIDNRQFEDDTGKLLSAIGFDVVMRPKPVIETKTNIEILAKYSSNEYCIFDAKNYAHSFSLSSTLRSLMHAEYIPNYDNYEGGTLTHYGYVTAAKFSGAKFLPEITEKAKLSLPNREITGIIVSANALLGYLDYCKIEEIGKKERLEIFVNAIQNKGYSVYQELLSSV